MRKLLQLHNAIAKDMWERSPFLAEDFCGAYSGGLRVLPNQAKFARCYISNCPKKAPETLGNVVRALPPCGYTLYVLCGHTVPDENITYYIPKTFMSGT
eukprot:2814748-Amphidinium_carterae.1